MLLEFKIKNYLSFKDEATFSMVASRIGEHKDTNIFSVKDINLLKMSSLYGANASGKSNLLKALNFMKTFVLKSSKESQINENIDVVPFKLDTETIKRPSFFQVIFILNKIQYRYGFEVNKEQVINEWLFYKPIRKEYLLFTRQNNLFEISSKYKEGNQLINKTRNNALFLSVCAQFNGDISTSILKWFKNINLISGSEAFFYSGYSINKMKDKIFKDKALSFLNYADMNIDGIDIVEKKLTSEDLPNKMPEDLKKYILNNQKDQTHFDTYIKHKQFNPNNNTYADIYFDLGDEESEGTQKLFYLSGPIIDTLVNGKILLMDEIDNSLHTLLVKYIIELFNSKETNKNNAQLIVATHNTNILSNKYLRRDQIWFTEKNKMGATDLYSLVEYKLNVRKDATYNKDYINGKYGAIPFIGDFKSLLKGKKC